MRKKFFRPRVDEPVHACHHFPSLAARFCIRELRLAFSQSSATVRRIQTRDFKSCKEEKRGAEPC
jgi:hypothetical protein